VVLRIWGQHDNFLDPHERLNEIFGVGMWNMNSSVIQKGQASLHTNTSSSIFSNLDYCELKVLFYVFGECEFDQILFDFEVFGEFGKSIFKREIILPRYNWYVEDVTEIFSDGMNFKIIKKLRNPSDGSVLLKDTIDLRKDSIEKYTSLKFFEKIKL
jgi:hypothetical protein